MSGASGRIMIVISSASRSKFASGGFSNFTPTGVNPNSLPIRPVFEFPHHGEESQIAPLRALSQFCTHGCKSQIGAKQPHRHERTCGLAGHPPQPGPPAATRALTSAIALGERLPEIVGRVVRRNFSNRT